MEQGNIIKAIQEASSEGRLTCEAAHALADKLNISLKEIGVICNQLQIKISVCQLGCF